MRGCFVASGDQSASAFTVQAEVFGTTGRDQSVGAGFGHQARCGGVGVEVGAEPLIREIDDRGCAARGDQSGDGVPVIERRVDAGWVVTASVQDDCVARFHRGEVRQHPVEVQHAVLGIAIGAQRQATVADDREVVGPCGCRHPDRGSRHCTADEVERERHRPRSADRRDGGCFTVIRAQHQIGHGAAKRDVAREVRVGFGGLGVHDPPFRRRDSARDGRQALGRFEDANAEVDFAWARVSRVGPHQPDDGIRGLILQPVKEGCHPLATLRSSYMPHSDHDPS